MNLHHLRIFSTVSQQQSLSRGAEALFVSQPAVSKQIQELEAVLKVRLFDRLPRGVRLTEAGALLYDHARRIFQTEADAERALRELRGLERGRLLIGASTTIGDYLLPGVIARFHAAYPGIEISLTVANTREIQARLMDGSIDLGFTEGFPQDNAFTSTVFLNDDLVVIVAPGSVVLQESRVTLERICREPFILREPGSGTWAVVERELAERGVSVQAIMSLGSSEAIKRCVMSGAGVGIVSRLTVADELASGHLRQLEIEDLILRRPLHRIQLRGRQESVSVQAFLKTLAETLA